MALFSLGAWKKPWPTGLVAAAVAATPAAAQTVPAAPLLAASASQAGEPAATQSAAPIETVVVTAEKKSERLQDTPVPVTVLNTTRLSEVNQVRLQDYFEKVPGLSIDAEGNGQSNIILRGIASARQSNPTVGILINDVPFGSSTVLGDGDLLAPDLDPADLLRIEVLRGPQGTLYGASSLGGLIKYVTADPSTRALTGRVETDVDGTVDGGVGYGVRGGINIPVSDTLAVRVSGFSRQTPGYVDNVVNGDRDVNFVSAQGGNVAVLWAPNQDLSVRLGAILQDTSGKGYDGVTTTYNQQPLYGDLKQNEPPGSGLFDSFVQLYTSEIRAHLGSVDLTSVTGYGLTDYSSNPSFQTYDSIAAAATATATSAGIDGAELGQAFETRKFTQELRVASSPAAYSILGHRVDWLAGVFYDNETTPSDQYILAVDPLTGRTAGSVLDITFPSTYEEVAGFGDVTLHLTPRFDIQGGVRYAYNHQTYRERDDYDPTLGVPSPQFFSSTSYDSPVTFLVTPSYRLSPNAMLYARIASGYRPGGPNADIVPGSGVPTSYHSDTTINYELGAKGDLLNHRLTYDLSAYDIEWSNIQIQLTDPVTQFIYFANALSARSTGAEFALNYRLTPALRIVANGSYDVAELTQAIPAGGGVGSAGSPLPFVPRFEGSLSVERDVRLSNDWIATASATLSYVGRRYEAFVDSPGNLRVTLPDYEKLDLRVTAHDPHWSVTLFANNATDTRGVLSTISQAGSVSTATSLYNTIYIQPLTVGLSVVRFF